MVKFRLNSCLITNFRWLCHNVVTAGRYYLVNIGDCLFLYLLHKIHIFYRDVLGGWVGTRGMGSLGQLPIRRSAAEPSPREKHLLIDPNPYIMKKTQTCPPKFQQRWIEAVDIRHGRCRLRSSSIPDLIGGCTARFVNRRTVASERRLTVYATDTSRATANALRVSSLCSLSSVLCLLSSFLPSQCFLRSILLCINFFPSGPE